MRVNQKKTLKSGGVALGTSVWETRGRSVVHIGLLIVMLLPVSVSAWEGKQDNKSVAELELMDDYEIAGELFAVSLTSCLRAQIANKRNTPADYDWAYQPHVDAREYAELIGRVVRKKHQGMPDWMTRLQAALQANDLDAVEQIQHELYEKVHAKQKSQPVKSKQKGQRN